MRLLPVLFALMPAAALAHEGHHEQFTPALQVRHMLTQPDHVLALAALVVLAVAGGWTWRRASVRARK